MELEEEKEVLIVCPTCNARGIVRVPREKFAKIRNEKFKTLKIQVSIGFMCEHVFIAFVDSKGQVKGYETVDPRVIDLLNAVDLDLDL